MIETFRDIALDEPHTAHPVMVDFLQGRMASSFWSEPVGMGTELGFKIRV